MTRVRTISLSIALGLALLASYVLARWAMLWTPSKVASGGTCYVIGSQWATAGQTVSKPEQTYFVSCGGYLN